MILKFHPITFTMCNKILDNRVSGDSSQTLSSKTMNHQSSEVN